MKYICNNKLPKKKYVSGKKKSFIAPLSNFNIFLIMMIIHLHTPCAQTFDSSR